MIKKCEEFHSAHNHGPGEAAATWRFNKREMKNVLFFEMNERDRELRGPFVVMTEPMGDINLVSGHRALTPPGNDVYYLFF